ncbi:amino acid permease [[Mycoplasma] phocae]|uniref:Amino acid permease n=1 Tax=[Mycoplasma] phocae TaxID=142651 RepID=A0A2Z5IPW0_9BACT|nr:APC family permease [[Mycoplasma] phocae]AXE60504.1 amino acid permease [[Mycoplasma] phocae]
MAEEQLVVTSSPKKKIGFFSAILVVLGGSIGVGIFLRAKSVLENSAGNIIWALAIWLIAGFAVIALALALVEVASGRNDNLGMIGWSKAFNTLYIYKANKFFMTYLYLPFTYFFMPYYVIVQFQDGLSGFDVDTTFGGSTAAPWLYFLIGLVLTVWILLSAGLSSKAGNIQNWIVTAFKFIPLVAIVVVGIYFAATRNTAPDADGPFLKPITRGELFDARSTSFLGLSPFLLVFSSIGGIFFAFDGFYVSAGIQSEMKNPEKTPAALVIGLLSMTILYMFIAAAMTLGAKSGGFYDYGAKLKDLKLGWIFGLINIFISIGVIGILNAFTMWATRWVEDLIREGEMFVPARAYRYLKNSKYPVVGMLFCFLLSLPLMIIFTAIGAYAYIGSGYDPIYGYKINNLLTFADLMANWMAVFAFAFIAIAVLGAIQNRKKHFIAVKENKHTIWAGYTSVIIVLSVLILLMIDPFISIGLSAAEHSRLIAAKAKEADIQGARDSLIGNSATAALFVIFVVIMFLSTYIEKVIADRNKVKYDRVLSGKICECEIENWCPCKLALLKESAELNDLVLKTYAEARR